MVEPLLSKLGIQFKSYKSMHIQSKESIDLHNFYPTQTCSNICGVIVLCMAAIMCCDWQSWQSWNDSKAPKCSSKPSLYSNHLRLTVISCILEEEIDINGIILDFKQIQESQAENFTLQYDSESDNCYSADEVSTCENFITAILPSKYKYKVLK